MTVRLERIAAVVARTGRSRATIYADIKAGTFPPPVRLGGRASAWVASEIDEWIAARIAERDAARTVGVLTNH